MIKPTHDWEPFFLLFFLHRGFHHGFCLSKIRRKVMAKDPAFLMYSSDFLVGTSLMTHEQVGKYIRLLLHQHQRGRLTEQQVILICGDLDAEVMSKFTQDKNGNFFNKRLEEESKKRKDYSDSRRKNRQKGLECKRKHGITYDKHMNNICETYDVSYEQHMENENENEDENENTIKQKPIKNIIPPTFDMVNEYCISRNNTIDAQHFHDFYEAKGWKVGKEKMKDWQACIRTWEKRDSGKEQKPINWFEVE